MGQSSTNTYVCAPLNHEWPFKLGSATHTSALTAIDPQMSKAILHDTQFQTPPCAALHSHQILHCLSSRTLPTASVPQPQQLNPAAYPQQMKSSTVAPKQSNLALVPPMRQFKYLDIEFSQDFSRWPASPTGPLHDWAYGQKERES